MFSLACEKQNCSEYLFEMGKKRPTLIPRPATLSVQLCGRKVKQSLTPRYSKLQNTCHYTLLHVENIIIT